MNYGTKTFDFGFELPATTKQSCCSTDVSTALIPEHSDSGTTNYGDKCICLTILRTIADAGFFNGNHQV